MFLLMGSFVCLHVGGRGVDSRQRGVPEVKVPESGPAMANTKFAPWANCQTAFAAEYLPYVEMVESTSVKHHHRSQGHSASASFIGCPGGPRQQRAAFGGQGWLAGRAAWSGGALRVPTAIRSVGATGGSARRRQSWAPGESAWPGPRPTLGRSLAWPCRDPSPIGCASCSRRPASTPRS